MFARKVAVLLKPDTLPEFTNLMEREILPWLRKQEGFLDLITLAVTDSRAPLAQLDRASGYEPEGREFESLRAHHIPVNVHHNGARAANRDAPESLQIAVGRNELDAV
jgi:hypothetical protein